MKSKFKIILSCALCAVAVIASSAFFTAQAYFTDKSVGWTCTYRLPNTSYQIGSSYMDGSTLHTFDFTDTSSTEDEINYTLKIKNTGNVDIQYECITIVHERGTFKDITVKAGEEVSLDMTYTAVKEQYRINSDTDYLNFATMMVTPKAIIDETGSYPISGDTKTTVLYFNNKYE